jgi:hypothetical protein
LFEKIAIELTDDTDVANSEVINNIEELEIKASVSARRAILKSLAK